ncbi:hypothetical protein PENTCL1PPCAC_17184, partial [Pristionchus entomophagus]
LRECFWPISVFLVHPFTIFVLIRKSPMSIDCKSAFVVHHIVLMCFDYYNGALYQMYTMAPIPVFICTGLMCHGAAEGTSILTGLSILTISLCFPYLFIMLRMHQKMLFQGSPLKVNKNTQVFILLLLTATLISNIFGFYRWTVDIPEKEEILNKEDLIWARNYSSNFLVLGKSIGDIGPFTNELILLAISILINFTFYVSITYHAVYKLGRQMTHVQSKTHELQLRFIYSLTIQAILTACFFITPLALLFVALVIDLSIIIPDGLFAFSRFLFLMLFSTCSFSHSAVFLSKNPWFKQHVKRRVLRSQVTPNPTNMAATTIAFDGYSRARSIFPGSSSY